ncbi:MAG: hypothetical protein IH948_09040 [Bacteroidetes bacterium]|nr:hypothetical protein [Bacteroidota bacterium]
MKQIIKLKWVIVLVILIPITSSGKELGVSFSYLFPKNGYFSSPIAPLSIRGVGISLGESLSLGTGVSWYNISGVQVIKTGDFPFTTPVLGPLTTFLFPLELTLKIPLGVHRFELIGGGFLFFNSKSRINEGNLDNEFLRETNWKVLNGDYYITNGLGTGFDYGGSLVIYVKKNIGLTFKAMYMVGYMPIKLEGWYHGYDQNDVYQTKNFSYKDSKMDITGWELSIGAVFTAK